MRTRPLGASGIEASVVGFGAWAIGGWMWGGSDERTAMRAIDAAIAAGVTLFDTAPMYGFGQSEEILGRALSGRRDGVVLATKCGLVWTVERGRHFFDTHREPVGHGAPDKHVYRYLGPESIRVEVEESLKRLRTDRIDLYQTHWQDPTTPIADTMGELTRLREEGKIRAIGASNASVDELRAYCKAGRLDSDQERYSMLDRAPEEAQMGLCAQGGIAFLAYAPLAQGLLTGQIGPERVFPTGDLRRGNERFNVENRRRVARLLERVGLVADAQGVTLSQLAVAWTLHQRGCTHALTGIRTPEQAIENAAAGDVLLADEDLQRISDALDAHASS